MIDVFLSASVPLPTRNPLFFETANVPAIREAVKALVEVVLPIGRITFGGHPAITPMIDFFVREDDLPRDRLTIFQSRFFEGMFPKENVEFHDVRVIEAVDKNLDLSLLRMRTEMINSRPFGAAVFIGGMEGIEEEAKLFADLKPNAILLPIASTGAAAAQLFHRGAYPPELKTELTYVTLFRRRLVLAARGEPDRYGLAQGD